MDNMKHRRLQELKRSDFDIVDGEPDIRGWDVKNAQGQKIGEVEELIVDAQQKKVRYMVVDLDDNELDIDDDREVLIPIGLAQLHKDDDDVILPNVQVQQLGNLPDYDEDRLDETMERQVCSVFGRTNESMGITTGAGTTATTSATTEQHHPDFYKHDYFNDDNLYKDRLHQLPSGKNKDSDYERGLRLWERRSEGGILSGDDSNRRNRTGNEDSYSERERSERLQTVQNRRSDDQQNDSRNRDNNEERTGNII
jgi:sporulation protein YlmC with PRC-barrel domain